MQCNLYRCFECPSNINHYAAAAAAAAAASAAAAAADIDDGDDGGHYDDALLRASRHLLKFFFSALGLPQIGSCKPTTEGNLKRNFVFQILSLIHTHSNPIT
jgi:hypothetical protein